MKMGKNIREVITGFLYNNGNILILLRSQKVGSYQGKWAGVSGFVEKENTPDEQVYIEIWEETGLEKGDLNLLKKGEPFDVFDHGNNLYWRVHPYLFAIEEPKKIRIDWEHSECKWIKPDELKNFDTVPSLLRTLEAVI